MLSGLSSLLFGNGGTDDAAVDQTLASQPTPLDTQDTDNGWVLVDVAGDESNSQPEHQPIDIVEQPVVQLESTILEGEDDEQAENWPRGRPVGNAVQPEYPCRTDIEKWCAELAFRQVRQKQVFMSKQLNKKHLELSNKARMVQSSGRKLASGHSRVLRPSGRMNGRHCQRKF